MIRIALAGAAIVAGVALAGTSPAAATSGGTETPAGSVAVESKCLKGWYTNADEADRRPTQTATGLEFVGNDLVHHSTNFPLKLLKPGSFNAHPAPSLSSFFSVEIRDTTTNAYGTLRWNTSTSQWDLVTNLGAFSKANPADYVGTATKWGTITDKARVVSFGVGYVNTPNNGTKTIVSSVKFGHTYDLTCRVRPTKPTPTVLPTKPTKPVLLPCKAYVYTGTQINLCKDFPGIEDRDCGPKRGEVHFRVTLANKWFDPWGLDGRGPNKGNGIGCEDRPKCPDHTPPTTTPTTVPTTVPTTTPTTTPTTVPTTQPTATQTTTTPDTVPVGNVGGGNTGGPALPVTGPAGIVLLAVGVAGIIGGAVLFVMTRRRKQTFEA